MRYLCVHCDHRWEEAGDEAPRRCPSCMRATGVEPVRDGVSTKKGPGKGRHVVLLAVAAVAVGLVVLLVARRTKPTAPGELAATAPSDLRTALQAEHVDTAGLEQLFAVDAAMESRAEALTDAADGNLARAQAVQAFLRARAGATAFVPWPLAEPRDTPVMVAKETYAALEKDKARARLYPLEVAVVAAALLRTASVPAFVAELADGPGQRAPLDPSGFLGYFVIAVYDGEPGQGTPHLFDPYGGRTLGASDKAQVLSDVQVVASLLSLRAVYELAFHADPKAALELSTQALSLAKNLPSVRAAHAVSVLGSGMLEQAMQELTAARQQRPDAARMHYMARVMLSSGRVEEAQAELTAALSKAPDFAEARATLASLLALRGDGDAAAQELDKAVRFSPDSPVVLWAQAEQALRGGQKAEALDFARRAHDGSPSFESKVRFAALSRQAGDYDAMRKLAHEAVDMAPAYRKAELSALLKQVLGPTALDAVEPDPGADDLTDLGGPKLDLKLGDSSDKGQLHLGAEGGSGGPLILSGDQQKLRLGGSSGDDFKLKLDP